MNKESHNLPGTLVSECDMCEGYRKEIKDLKKIIRDIEKLAEWYDYNVNSSISAHRIKQALVGNLPTKKK